MAADSRHVDKTLGESNLTSDVFQNLWSIRQRIVAVKDSIYWKQANMKQPISVEKMNEFTGLLEHVAKRIEKFKT
ncbi:MAG: hypothetical protein M1504_01925, partial [Candidatus Marsarchaeota archaeon]|nr:hypothetical protein [Candidatus Marsarchaeota archaeon]